MNIQNKKSNTITLVLGASGKTGLRVVNRLKARGLPVRAGSRSTEPPFDWGNKATWEPALKDIKSVYVVYVPDLAMEGAADAVRTFAKTAVKQVVKRLVLLSGRGEEGALISEQAIQEAGVDWTILRSSWFNQNFSEGYLLDPILGGEVALPVGEVGEPFVDADDIADVAVAALTEDGHAGQVYEMTGPRLLTFRDAVGEIARATGRAIRFEPISLEAYASQMAEYRVPGEIIGLMKYLFTEVLDGRNARLTNGIQRALGRAPRDFSEFARAAAATGAWSVSSKTAA